MMRDIWHGVQRLLDSYAKVDDSDFVIILFTSDALESAAWVSAALEARGIAYTRVWMIPLEDPDLAERLRTSMPAPDEVAGRIVLMSFERDTMSHTTTLLNLMRLYEPAKITAVRGISAGEEFFSVGLAPTPDEIEARNTFLLEKFIPATTLRITTPGGSDFTVTLDSSKHRWISNRGRLKLGGTMILPAGEVATYPASVDGTFVADFAYNINTITDRDVRLGQTPITLRLSGEW